MVHIFHPQEILEEKDSLSRPHIALKGIVFMLINLTEAVSVEIMAYRAWLYKIYYGLTVFLTISPADKDSPNLIIVVPLTLPMLRLLQPKNKDANTCENHLNPVILVFIGWLSTTYSQISTHMLGFWTFFRFFASFCIGQNSHQQHKG